MLVKSLSLKRSAIWLLSSSALMSFCGPVYACELISESTPTAPSIDYDVYGFGTAIGSTEFDLRNAGDSNCELEILIEDLASFPPPFDFPQAGINVGVTAPSLQRPQDGNNRSGIFALSLPPSTSKRVQLDFFAEQLVSVPSGTYSQDIIIGVRRAGQNALLENFITNIALTAESRAQVNIAGASGVFDKGSYMDSVDFGEAKVGENRRVFIQTRSNAPATMTIRSENNGKMKHQSSTISNIGYSASLEGQLLDLSRPYVIPNLTETNIEGTSRSLDLTIESLNQAFAGQYTDRIVIEIEAR